MPATIADYYIILSGSIVLPPEQTNSFNLEMPNIEFNGVLIFDVSTENPGPVLVEIELNDDPVVHHTFTTGTLRALSRVVRVLPSNKIKFKTSGGQAHLSNMVLFYQRTVP